MQRGIEFLYRSQLPYGEFKSYASSDVHMQADCRLESSVFPTALILYALDFLADRPQVQAMIARGLDFLLSEMEGSGLWRYWTGRDPQHERLQPDLDDVCCVSQLLQRHERPFPDNRPLVLACRDLQGRFYTYVAPRPGTPPELRQALGSLVSPQSLLALLAAGMLHEVDAAVNANVVLYLGQNEHTQAAIDYLLEAVHQPAQRRHNRYYLSLAFEYMLSRACFASAPALNAAKIPIIERLNAAPQVFDTPLAAALAACTLLNFNDWDSPLPEALQVILQTQRADGSWPCSPLYLGPAPYYGSEEMTSGFCLEALGRYIRKNLPLDR